MYVPHDATSRFGLLHFEAFDVSVCVNARVLTTHRQQCVCSHILYVYLKSTTISVYEQKNRATQSLKNRFESHNFNVLVKIRAIQSKNKQLESLKEFEDSITLSAEIHLIWNENGQYYATTLTTCKSQPSHQMSNAFRRRDGWAMLCQSIITDTRRCLTMLQQ